MVWDNLHHGTVDHHASSDAQGGVCKMIHCDIRKKIVEPLICTYLSLHIYWRDIYYLLHLLPHIFIISSYLLFISSYLYLFVYLFFISIFAYIKNTYIRDDSSHFFDHWRIKKRWKPLQKADVLSQRATRMMSYMENVPICHEACDLGLLSVPTSLPVYFLKTPLIITRDLLEEPNQETVSSFGLWFHEGNSHIQGWG